MDNSQILNSKDALLTDIDSLVEVMEDFSKDPEATLFEFEFTKHTTALIGSIISVLKKRLTDKEITEETVKELFGTLSNFLEDIDDDNDGYDDAISNSLRFLSEK